ncbi:fluoride efflux transporter CrcB [Paenibacillus hunanensis]|uniref:fluoride efflux transporter CrcB n=1 Tax=Paenibacillus hunanensis TaxID=539262 RepID=UPI0020270BFF|nr:fluoride efflux transporter CrcB [Paenibacillus hunanensis]MCL9662016.1 fluoride efflux transporter CrcB [Paenibacillus hunanensis]
MLYVLVALAGVIGAVCRYLIGMLIPSHGFPLATLVLNLTGCFLLAIVMRYLARLPRVSSNMVTVIGTGFVGSYTTFSTFSLESIQLIEHQMYITALLYIGASLIGGLLFTWLGFVCSERLLARKEARTNAR